MNNILDLSSSLDFNNNNVVKGEIEIDDVFELENNIEILVQDKTIEPTKETQTVTVDEDYDQLGTVTVNPIPDEYIIPDGTLDVDTNGDVDVTMFRTARVGVYIPPELQDKEVIPTKNEQIVRYDENYDGLNQVTVKSIPNEYIVPIGTLEINENGNKDVRKYANVNVNIDNEINLQSKPITITENGTQNITADENYNGLNSVSITTNVPALTIPDCTSLFTSDSRNDIIDKLLPFCNGTTNCANMFYYCNGLTSLDLNNFDTSNVTDMHYMFYYCNGLTTLDLSSFNTSNVTDMCYMFSNCKRLTDLDLNNFNTSNVTNMCYMFEFCSALTSLDLSNFNTEKVTNMNYMFSSCYNLKSLNINNFNTSLLTSMTSIFSGCKSLKSLNVSSFNTSKVTNMDSMFYNCSALTNLDLSNFDTSKVTNMSYMFSTCRKLETLDLSSFDFTKVTAFRNMFTNCGLGTETKLTTVYVKDEIAQNWILTKSNSRPSTWSTANVIIKEV